jgi:hypothetical protein
MKLWIDDDREPPEGEGWVWVMSSAEALKFLRREWIALRKLEEIAFDHDLGLAGMYDEQGRPHTTRPVMDWIIEHDAWPERISIHSGNPIGHRALYLAAVNHAPEGVDIVAKFK